MSKVLTLVNTNGLPTGLERAVLAFLRESEVVVGEMRSFPLAWEVHFSGEDPDLQKFANEWRVDYAIQTEESLPKRLLVSDMESTLVENEFLDDLAELAGVGERVRAITARAMNGEIDFAGSLRERLGLLRGQSVELLERAWLGLNWTPGARELVKALNSRNVPTVIVSGGFKFFTKQVCALLQAERDEANDLEIIDGFLTGNPIEPILGRENKERILRETAAAMGISMEQTASVGDGANDLPMLKASGLGVAYRAKTSVAAAADYRVQYSDLRAVGCFMGYADTMA